MSASESEILQLLIDVKKRDSKLNAWEANFIGALSQRISHGRSLSDNQVNKLENIWEKVTKEG